MLHTGCALFTGVQTCARPFPCPLDGRSSSLRLVVRFDLFWKRVVVLVERRYAWCVGVACVVDVPCVCVFADVVPRIRSEERRVGKEYVSTFRFRWSQSHEKNKNAKIRNDPHITNKKLK